MKLKDYYKNVVNINDNGGGWAGFYYGVFSSVINENNYKKIAEVGIGYGTHAKYILKNNSNIEHLFLIDPMIYYPNDGFTSDIMNQEPEIKGENFNEMFNLISNELLNYKDKYTWFRKKSLEIEENEIPDESLDAVFLDGAHDYDNVYKDINFWYKKIRKGGQILGDDYWISDVQKAVADFSRENQIQFDLLHKNDKPEYKIFRFHK